MHYRLARRASYLLLVCALVSTVLPLLPSAETLPVWKHHLAHGLVLGLAAGAGILFAQSARPVAIGGAAGPAGWAYVTVLVPIMSMFLMWPTTYEWLEHHPLAHGGEHLCFVILGFLAGYGGEKYVPGVGWIASAATVLTAVVAAGGFGITFGDGSVEWQVTAVKSA